MKLFSKIKNIFISEEKQKVNEFKKKLIEEFLKEHEAFIPKYSPKGLKLDWNIYVYPDGKYDLFTGKFIGEYKVGISQNPPTFLSKDNAVYEYDIENKKMNWTGYRWA